MLLQSTSLHTKSKVGVMFAGDLSDQTYVLNVELEVLGVTEGRLQRLDSELLTSLVGETHQEPHDFIGRKL